MSIDGVRESRPTKIVQPPRPALLMLHLCIVVQVQIGEVDARTDRHARNGKESVREMNLGRYDADRSLSHSRRRRRSTSEELIHCVAFLSSFYLRADSLLRSAEEREKIENRLLSHPSIVPMGKYVPRTRKYFLDTIGMVLIGTGMFSFFLSLSPCPRILDSLRY